MQLKFAHIGEGTNIDAELAEVGSEGRDDLSGF